MGKLSLEVNDLENKAAAFETVDNKVHELFGDTVPFCLEDALCAEFICGLLTELRDRRSDDKQFHVQEKWHAMDDLVNYAFAGDSLPAGLERQIFEIKMFIAEASEARKAANTEPSCARTLNCPMCESPIEQCEVAIVHKSCQETANRVVEELESEAVVTDEMRAWFKSLPQEADDRFSPMNAYCDGCNAPCQVDGNDSYRDYFIRNHYPHRAQPNDIDAVEMPDPAPESFRVRILASNAWHTNLIGTVLLAQGDPTEPGRYQIIEPPPNGYRLPLWIPKSDCEIVPDNEPEQKALLCSAGTLLIAHKGRCNFHCDYPEPPEAQQREICECGGWQYDHIRVGNILKHCSKCPCLLYRPAVREAKLPVEQTFEQWWKALKEIKKPASYGDYRVCDNCGAEMVWFLIHGRSGETERHFRGECVPKNTMEDLG